MEKALENARFAQTFLVAAAAAALIFSLSSPSVENYGLMEKLLAEVQSLNFERPKKAIDGALAERLQNSQFYRLMQVYNSSNPPLPISAEFFDWQQYKSIDELQNTVQSRSLGEIDNAIARKNPVMIFLPDFPQLFATFKASSAIFELNEPYLKKGFKIRFSKASNRPEYGYQVHLTWPHPEPSQAAAGIERFEQLGGRNFPGQEGLFENVDLSSWMHSELGVGPLWSILRPPIWSDIKGVDVSRALLVVKNLNAQTQKSFSFTSLTIPSAMMILAGPAILIAIMLYLLVHLNHLHLLRRSAKSDQANYPWICLYPDPLSRIVSLASTVVLPVVSCILLVTNIEGVSQTARSAGAVLCVACAVLAIFLGRRVARLPGAFTAGDVATSDPRS